MKLTLTVVAAKHPDTVDSDDPSTVREIGFKVTSTLTSDTQVAETLQDSYRLEQWVKDKYWLDTRDSDSSTDWETGDEEGTDWERDEFGGEDDHGVWFSTRSETQFLDEPGFLGMGGGANARALTRRQRLGSYEIWFKWKIFDGGTLLLETGEIALKADPDDANNITYTGMTTETWEVTVP
jgi:hypothetical protein